MSRPSQQTSIEDVEKAALELLAVQGFDETSAEEIAAAAGISRRTFFRYFGTKNNIPFGNYSALLRELEDWLLSQPDERPLFEVIVEAVVRFNRVHTDGPVAHRERMELIMHTPALRANAALVNAEWQAVLARYAAKRMGEPVEAWEERISALLPYQVDAELMRATGNPEARFMHCLPAFHDTHTDVGQELMARHPELDSGLEVTDEVFESPASIVFDQAENRLHTIKALMVATLV